MHPACAICREDLHPVLNAPCRLRCNHTICDVCCDKLLDADYPCPFRCFDGAPIRPGRALALSIAPSLPEGDLTAAFMAVSAEFQQYQSLGEASTAQREAVDETSKRVDKQLERLSRNHDNLLLEIATRGTAFERLKDAQREFVTEHGTYRALEARRYMLRLQIRDMHRQLASFSPTGTAGEKRKADNDICFEEPARKRHHN